MKSGEWEGQAVVPLRQICSSVTCDSELEALCTLMCSSFFLIPQIKITIQKVSTS